MFLSIANNKEKRKKMEKRLNGMNVTFIKGVEGKQLTIHQLINMNDI